jgi:hypothetical protein
LQMAAFSVSSGVSSYKDTKPQSSTPMISFNLHYLNKGLISKNSHVGGSGFSLLLLYIYSIGSVLLEKPDLIQGICVLNSFLQVWKKEGILRDTTFSGSHSSLDCGLKM